MASLRMASCVLLTALSAGAALQTNTYGQQNSDKAPVVAEQAADYWRASKLIGVGVFGLQGERIGSIGEVLVDHNGVAQVAVIDVGGFFGIGRKAVGVSFAALKWVSHEDAAPKTYNTPPKDSPIAIVPKRPEAKPATDASRGYPDRAIIGLTKAQLKQAPDFRYARATFPTTETPTGPAGPLHTPAGPAAPP